MSPLTEIAYEPFGQSIVHSISTKNNQDGIKYTKAKEVTVLIYTVDQLDNNSPIMVAVASKHSLYRSLSWTAAGLLGHGWAVGGPGSRARDCSAV